MTKPLLERMRLEANANWSARNILEEAIAHINTLEDRLKGVQADFDRLLKDVDEDSQERGGL